MVNESPRPIALGHDPKARATHIRERRMMVRACYPVSAYFLGQGLINNLRVIMCRAEVWCFELCAWAIVTYSKALV